jgi:hypothetical protein
MPGSSAPKCAVQLEVISADPFEVYYSFDENWDEEAYEDKDASWDDDSAY